MTTYEQDPRVPMRPADAHRAAETAMKAVLGVAAFAGALLLLFFLYVISMAWGMAG
ncbi:hypothetical protein ACGFRG_02495 [Streptomyces sp. NPDC048696]|uniref:hypothetical protein n=1 Tax=Streptomyces sp. NPDC048696 TaxID=3365585 RepID=UPI003710FF72